jgi:hypothetical protein
MLYTYQDAFILIWLDDVKTLQSVIHINVGRKDGTPILLSETLEA